MNNHYGLNTWLTFGERGISSEAVADHLTGRAIRRGFNDPSDPSDFRRCELLLRAVPTFRKEFPRMAEVSPRWAALVKNWDELVALMEAEVPGCFDGKPYPGATAPRTYEMMRGLGTPS